MASKPGDPTGIERGRPPVFGSWRRLYIVVLSVLAVLIVIFYLITKAFE